MASCGVCREAIVLVRIYSSVLFTAEVVDNLKMVRSLNLGVIIYI